MISEKNYHRIDFKDEVLQAGEYESCKFSDCIFSEVSLKDFRFMDCRFENCDLSSMRVDRSTFADVVFEGCKMLGIQFDKAASLTFSIQASECTLSHSTFYDLPMQETLFSSCRLEGVDFTGADLHGARFVACDLLNARFERCNLRDADFSTATGYQFDPELNRIKGAKFSLEGLVGLLAKHEIKIQ